VSRRNAKQNVNKKPRNKCKAYVHKGLVLRLVLIPRLLQLTMCLLNRIKYNYLRLMCLLLCLLTTTNYS
jgi:hypothetical protein